MASFNFGLLELADGESGEAAVSVVVGKAKAEAAHAKKAAAAAESAAPGTTEKEKAVHKNLYYFKLRHDNGTYVHTYPYLNLPSGRFPSPDLPSF
jgi:hypothetical protein